MRKYCLKRKNVVLVNVTADMVRDRLNLTVADVEDVKVVEMIKDATATIGLETGLSSD